jgi:hypothetical protein
MTIETWLDMATSDAERRGLPELKPLLEALAKATSALRAADWNADASGEFHPHEPSSGSFDPGSRVPDPGSRR